MTKHIFVTGGVASSLGKGLTASSLGRLLKSRGFNVTMQKLDPYINVDPGTMDPFEHGEVFVTEDGGETDLDLGHYERFIDEPLTRASAASTGSIYSAVLARERRGGYGGKTVQVIPHITDEIKSRITALGSDDVDVVISEVGGTVGDIEILPFLEAIRQFRLDIGRDNVCYIHVTLVPFIGPSGEQKTKPTQHSVTELRSRGIQPDIIVCRSEAMLSDELKDKISRLCDVEPSRVINAADADNIYEIPLTLHEDGLDTEVGRILRLEERPADLSAWHRFLEGVEAATKPVRIGIVGKYVSLIDAYLSVVEATKHGGFRHGAEIHFEWIEAESVPERIAGAGFRDLDGLIIPGGFGQRGFEGKISAAGHARTAQIPTLGICMGMHAMLVDFARNVLGRSGAHSSEFSPDGPDPVVALMEGQHDIVELGGTMRLGSHPAVLEPGSQVASAYGTEAVSERHRHRYEFNTVYREAFESAGLRFSGTSPDGDRIEFLELPGHPFWIGSQSHPEFKSRPTSPHPLFAAFVEAALARAEGRDPHLFEPDERITPVADPTG